MLEPGRPGGGDRGGGCRRAEDAFTWRLAAMEDLPALRALMAEAIGTLQRGFLTEAQIEASRG